MNDMSDRRKMRAESVIALLKYLSEFDPWTKTQFQKGMFVAELDAVDSGLRVPGFKFFRYHHGPYSKDMDLLVQRLHVRGLVDADADAPPRLTEAGNRLARVLVASLPDTKNNRAIMDVIERGVQRVRNRRWDDDLRHEIYAMEIVPMSDIYDRPMRIEDIPHFVDLVAPSEQVSAGARLDISPEIIDVALYPIDMTSDEREAVFTMYAGDVSELGLPS